MLFCFVIFQRNLRGTRYVYWNIQQLFGMSIAQLYCFPQVIAGCGCYLPLLFFHCLFLCLCSVMLLILLLQLLKNSHTTSCGGWFSIFYYQKLLNFFLSISFSFLCVSFHLIPFYYLFSYSFKYASNLLAKPNIHNLARV